MRLRSLVIVVLSLASAIVPLAPAGATACAPAAGGGAWPSYGGDETNSRHQPAEDAIGPLEAATLAPAWGFSTEGTGDITGTPVIADGCVFVGTNGGAVFALDADDGDVVWQTQVSTQAGINSTLAVADGVVYGHVDRVSSPLLVALDQMTGAVVWESVVSTDEGASLWSSPVVADGIVFSGYSGATHGGYAVLDAATGDVLARGTSIPAADHDAFEGGSILSTAAIDTQTGYAYVGTDGINSPSNIGDPGHDRMAALLKIDVDRSRPTFGEVVGSFKGIERLQPGLVYALDIQASPNLMRLGDRTLVGFAHKIGLYDAVDAETMEPVWTGVIGPWSPAGSNTSGFDGEAIYGQTTALGLYSLDARTGLPRWFSPTADGAHVAFPPAVANGVVYTVDAKGFIDGYDAATGAPVLHRPLWLGTGLAPAIALGSGVSVARNAVFAAVGTTFTDTGYVIALRPSL